MEAKKNEQNITKPHEISGTPQKESSISINQLILAPKNGGVKNVLHRIQLYNGFQPHVTQQFGRLSDHELPQLLDLVVLFTNLFLGRKIGKDFWDQKLCEKNYQPFVLPNLFQKMKNPRSNISKSQLRQPLNVRHVALPGMGLLVVWSSSEKDDFLFIS